MIDGVRHTPLKVIADERGDILHMLRRNDPHFDVFGEVYFSWINPGVAKAWQKHTTTTVNITVPLGAVCVVVFDDRKTSPTCDALHEYHLTPEKHALLTIPPGLWYGYFSVSETPSLIVNCATAPHDSAEQEKLPVENDVIPYRRQNA